MYTVIYQKYVTAVIQKKKMYTVIYQKYVTAVIQKKKMYTVIYQKYVYCSNPEEENVHCNL